MLTKILSQSLAQAKEAHHEFFTPEHVLATALQNDFVCHILAESGSDSEALRSNISDFLDIIPYHSDIVTWGSDNDVWRSFNLFCEICEKCGYDKFSYELLKILAFHSPQKYWQQDAVLKLDKLDGIKNPD